MLVAAKLQAVLGVDGLTVAVRAGVGLALIATAAADSRPCGYDSGTRTTRCVASIVGGLALVMVTSLTVSSLPVVHGGGIESAFNVLEPDPNNVCSVPSIELSKGLKG